MRWMDWWDRQGKIDRVCKAIAAGCSVYAGPLTAMKLNKMLEEEGIWLSITGFSYIPEGELLVLDFSSYELPLTDWSNEDTSKDTAAPGHRLRPWG